LAGNVHECSLKLSIGIVRKNQWKSTRQERLAAYWSAGDGDIC
jgi:hypothetical protein